MLQRPAFYDLDQEREVVLEEIAMYEDDPQDQIHDLVSHAVFPDQALGRPVIGTAAVIGTVPEAGVRAYHRGHYTAPTWWSPPPATSPTTAYGARRGLLAGCPAPRARVSTSPPARGRPRLSKEATEQYHLCLGGPGCRNDPRRHAHSVLDTVLGGSMSSRLFQEVREKRGLAYSVGSYTVGYPDAGQVGIYLGTREDNLATACEVIATELRRIGAEPLPDAELPGEGPSEGPRSSAWRLGHPDQPDRPSVLTGTELLTIDG